MKIFLIIIKLQKDLKCISYSKRDDDSGKLMVKIRPRKMECIG
jgi:hypothetical protein